MQLSEIKNDLATINYSPEINRLMLGDFILIEDSNQSILSQIISIEATMEEDVNSAMLKFLLSIDKDANLTQYSGYVPAKNASLILINPEEVVQLIKSNEKNIYLGNLAAYNNIPVELSLDFLRKKTYIQVDFVENKLHIVKSIINGLEKHNRKTLLFDFNGLYEGISLPTVTLGYNFKLPLNYDALCYIAEEELNDFGNENKAIIQGILIEVENYVKTTKDEFIPFDTLISVLDAQYDESPMPELLLLKNKLLKYQQQGLFAQEKSEFDFLDSFLKDAKNFKFDLSELPAQWHKIAFISILNIIKAKCYLITDFSDDNSNKTIIKKLYEKTEIKPIVISSYNYKYQLQLKAMSKNLILFKPIQKVNDFAGYTSFLNILSQDTFIIWGEQTLYIPLILKIHTSYESEAKLERVLYTNESTDYQKNEEAQKETSEHIIDEASNNNSESAINEEMTTEPVIIEKTVNTFEPVAENIPEKLTNHIQPEESTIVEETNNNDNVQLEQIQPEIEYEDDIPNSNDLEFFFDEESSNIAQTEALIEESIKNETDNTTNSAASQSIDSTDISDILEEVNNTDYIDETQTNEETIEELDSIENIDESQEQDNNSDDIIMDLDDAVFDESLNENSNSESAEEPVSHFAIDEDENQNDNEISMETNNEESVEDLINNLDTEEASQENKIIDEIKPAVEIKSPPVSVYTTNVAPQFDAKFAQGTYVHHPKYGRGVVEKVINYGAKELCLIIFDNEGRKLLDPNIAELKQI